MKPKAEALTEKAKARLEQLTESHSMVISSDDYTIAHDFFKGGVSFQKAEHHATLERISAKLERSHALLTRLGEPQTKDWREAITGEAHAQILEALEIAR